ncbi:MAG: MBL fold metallo-hydrolase [Selenomonas sp.]|nr:MBL fold metallo-hydrolase [Selenomonas sp.]
MGWKIKDYRDFSVHIYSAGEDGCRANSYIVETTSHLLIIDTQYLLPYAEKVKAMAVRLDKPIARVIITHAHPDHWFGTSVFAGEQIYALPTVRAEMAKDAITAFQRNKPRLGDKIGDEAVLPNYTLEKGNFVVDGVEFYVHEILNTETSSLAVLEIPAEKILFASDLVYAHTHIYVADNHIREWIAALQSCQKKTLGISSPDTEMIFLLRSCWRKWITCAVLARQWPRQNHFLNSGKECWSNIPTMPESSYWSLTRCFCYSLPTAIQKLMLDRAFFLDYNLHIQMMEGGS